MNRLFFWRKPPAAEIKPPSPWGEVSQVMARHAAREMLRLAEPMLKPWRKADAIARIKAQPFYGSALPEPTWKTIKLRRPIPWEGGTV